MSLCYILDGYNITAQIPSLSLKNLRGSREGLVRLIDLYHPEGSERNEVIVVFDGKPGMIGRDEGRGTKVLFSENESADDKIRNLVENSRRKKEIVVVTDDRDLALSIKLLGASALPVKDFLSKVKREDPEQELPKAGRQKREDEKKISKTLEYKITDELEKIWLKK